MICLLINLSKSFIMETCKNCGVELEKNMNFCPLCGEPVIEEGKDTEYIRIRKREQENKMLMDYQKLNAEEKRTLFRTISAIILLSGIIVTLIIDYLGNNDITWSKYPVVVCAVILANISLITFWHHRIILMLTGSFIATSALLVLLDMFNDNLGWGMKLGIPLLLAAYVIVFILIYLIRKAKHHGLNIIALSLIASGLLSLCTEGIISLYVQNRFHLEWSLIVMASVFMIAVLLLYIHYRLKKGTNLKRFFHI